MYLGNTDMLASPVPNPMRPATTLQPYRGVEDSVDHMRKLARDGQTQAEVRRHAIDVVRQVEPKDYLSELAALYYDVCRRVRYTRDPYQREMLHHPLLILRNRAGDCDDQAILLGALSLSIGNPLQFVVVGFDPKAPPQARYTHVFVRALDSKSGRWVVLDPVAGPNSPQMLEKVKVFKTYWT
jgi:transglutaminase-like putative cysteine protease